MPTSNEIDILAFEQDLRRTYERYIYTANLISDQEPELQDAFARCIGEDYSIFNGPYIHCTPCYRQAEMNALADDQLGRLRKLLVAMTEVTFGRYTGDTPEEVDDAERPSEVVANERYTRREIRTNPPHILLTNFAMLE